MNHTAPVVSGHGRGKLLGYPTFNLIIPKDLTDPYGIYAAWVWINGTRYAGALHFGPIPTFNNDSPTLEVFVLSYKDEEKVSEITFELAGYLREIRHFPTPEALSDQIDKDVLAVRALLHGQ